MPRRNTTSAFTAAPPPALLQRIVPLWRGDRLYLLFRMVISAVFHPAVWGRPILEISRRSAVFQEIFTGDWERFTERTKHGNSNRARLPGFLLIIWKRRI